MEQQESAKNQKEEIKRQKYLIGKKSENSNPYNPLSGQLEQSIRG
jgi:hypothetical protein